MEMENFPTLFGVRERERKYFKIVLSANTQHANI